MAVPFDFKINCFYDRHKEAVIRFKFLHLFCSKIVFSLKNVYLEFTILLLQFFKRLLRSHPFLVVFWCFIRRLNETSAHFNFLVCSKWRKFHFNPCVRNSLGSFEMETIFLTCPVLNFMLKTMGVTKYECR